MGCASHPRTTSADEVRFVAWWCEDVAHGIDRSPGELRSPQASEGALRLADWAEGAAPGRAQHLRSRGQRWPGLRSLLAAGALETRDGYLVVRDGIDRDTALLAGRLAEAENQDRRTAEVLVLTFLQPDEGLERELRRQLREARAALDARITP